MFELNFSMVAMVGLLTLLAICSEALRSCVNVLDVEITSWKIRCRRQNLAIRILKMLFDFFKKK